ncbi:MAG: peptidoglycan recognition family protein [Phycisphaerales bacterium]
MTTAPEFEGSSRPWSRRAVLGAGAACTLVYLGGCASSSRTSAALPGPVAQGIDPPPTALPPPTPAPVSAALEGLDVRPRSAWTSAGVARPLNIKPMRGIERITVHHDGMNAFTSTSDADAARRLENIRRAHLGRVSRAGEPWADIGYHYAVDPSGRVWEARSLDYQGAHVDGKNEHNIGIVMLGNYDKQAPNRAQEAALEAIVAAQMRRHRIPLARVFTHQELDRTACPGSTLQRLMLSARSAGGVLARA